MLVEAEELHSLLEKNEVTLLYSKLQPVGAAHNESITESFIPGSRVFDIEDFSCKKSTIPHVLLNQKEFSDKARKLGINQNSRICVYDGVGIYSSPRVWLNLKFMGCKDVTILNGGIQSWLKKGYNISGDSRSDHVQGNFSAQPNMGMVVDKEYVLKKISRRSCQIIDVRSADRFHGTAPEPRPGVKRGHIPGSINIPFIEFLHEHAFRQKAELIKIFEKADSQNKEEIIFLCGSGVTACIGYFAAHLCGIPNIKLYDGSWAEWGTADGLPIEI